MTNRRPGSLDQSLDIAGSTTQLDSLPIANELNKVGRPISGQSGLIGSITTVSSGIATLTSLSGFSAASVGRIIIISNAASAANNGIFIIASFISTSSITIENTSAIASDANNGSISWSENEPYTLEDDLNYNRSNIKLIKGTSNWYNDIPEYVRPTDTLTDIPANLTNISSKTLDAHAWIESRFKESILVSIGDTFITIIDSGNLKHADSVDITGIPIIDGYDSNNYISCFVEIVDGYSDGYQSSSSFPIPSEEGQVIYAITDEEFSIAMPLTSNQGWLVNDDGILLVATDEEITTQIAGSTLGSNLRVLSGEHLGERIFGITKEGSSISPNSIEIHFYSSSIVDWDLSSISLYEWEEDQPTIINLSYGYRQRLDLMNENVLRSTLFQGALSGGASSSSGSGDSQTSNTVGTSSFARIFLTMGA